MDFYISWFALMCLDWAFAIRMSWHADTHGVIAWDVRVHQFTDSHVAFARDFPESKHQLNVFGLSLAFMVAALVPIGQLKWFYLVWATMTLVIAADLPPIAFIFMYITLSAASFLCANPRNIPVANTLLSHSTIFLVVFEVTAGFAAGTSWQGATARNLWYTACVGCGMLLVIGQVRLVTLSLLPAAVDADADPLKDPLLEVPQQQRGEV